MNGLNTGLSTIGVVGLGLMGSSIVVSLLASGHKVVALAPLKGEKEGAAKHITDLLKHADAANLLKVELDHSVQNLLISETYDSLSNCAIVMECVIEDKVIKGEVYNKIADVVKPDTVIASNTSAIPISELQLLVPQPERFLGIHWAEPAYMTRFLEVTCGEQTDIGLAENIVELGKGWGKEPTLLKKDIRGFITNRLMYAVYREALALIEAGHTSILDADKAFRYDAGSWMTLMGLFRRMDFMGLDPDCEQSFKRLFTCLSNSNDVPALMQLMVDKKGRGIHNLVGLYDYTATEADNWEKAFAEFNLEIFNLAARYPENAVFVEQEKVML